MTRIPKEQVEALREQMIAWSAAVKRGAEPKRDDQNLVRILIEAILGDPIMRQVARNLGILNAKGHPTVSTGGRIRAYDSRIELAQRALAIEVAVERAEGLARDDAIPLVAKRRRKGKEDVEAAVEAYRFDDLVRQGDDLSAHRTAADNLWNSYRITRPPKKK